MNVATDIAVRIDNIRTIFQEAEATATGEDMIDNLPVHLDKYHHEYRSVAYEAAAMVVAIGDLEHGIELVKWSALLHGKGKKHAGQIHVGLGWAIGRLKISPISILQGISPMLQDRVMDGIGYCDMIFRQRQTMTSQVIPDYAKGDLMPGYDQGVGRGLWYKSKGDIEQLSAQVSAFPAERRADLWRGVGIACAYVGGCDEAILLNIYTAAQEHAPQLALGAAMVANSRTEAEATTPWADLACMVWCGTDTGPASKTR